MVPLIDRFVEEHPDFSYRGAKGIVALTGYNGILGYRTDSSYETRPDDLDAVSYTHLGYDKAMKISSKGYPSTGVMEAESEKVLRGSREGFSDLSLIHI